jgi:hypothetical protein
MKFEIEITRKALMDFRRAIHNIDENIGPDPVEILREFFFFEYPFNTIDLRDKVKIKEVK